MFAIDDLPVVVDVRSPDTVRIPVRAAHGFSEGLRGLPALGAQIRIRYSSFGLEALLPAAPQSSASTRNAARTLACLL